MNHILTGVLLISVLAVASPAVHAASDPQDEAAIKTTIESIGILADQGNFEAVEKLYADEVELDYTSLTGGEVERISPQALMTQWASVLPGFDRTRHALSDIAVTLDGTQAEATANVIADHYVGDLFWQVRGDYRYEFQKIDGMWRVTSHTFNLREESGTRDVFGPASKSAAANPASYIKRQQTKKSVRDFLTALEQPEFGLSEGEGGAGGKVQGRFLGLMAVGDEATEEIDEEVGGAAVAGVFDLGDIFELIEDGFDNRTFPQQELVRPHEEAGFHVAFERSQ